jgi:sensor histidine kinase YesM
MDNIIKHRWLRWSIYMLIGILFKFMLDVIYSLLYRNYPLFQPIEDYLYAILFALAALATMFHLRNYMDDRIAWEENLTRRYLAQWTMFLLSGIFFAFAVRWMFKLIFNVFYYVRVLDELIILLLVLFVITAMVTLELGLFLLNRWRYSLAELERFKKENAEFQFESLRSQVNPHFLFNSLNTLSSLIYEDQEKAGAFIRELSDVYRYILENRGKELVSLGEELTVARSYIYLVQLRFEKNLDVDLNVPEAAHVREIAPLTLQLLIENAVKHNVIARKKPLYIAIFVEQDYLVVKNNLQKKESREYSSQLGLKNIKSRYAFLTDRTMEILETKTEFIVKIPLIRS